MHHTSSEVEKRVLEQRMEAVTKSSHLGTTGSHAVESDTKTAAASNDTSSDNTLDTGMSNAATPPELAIIDSNTLSCIGLETILEGIIQQAVIRVFASFDKFVCDTPDMYAHYFVSSQIYFEHTSYFLQRFPKAIVLANGENLPQLKGVPTMDISKDEKHLIKSLLMLQNHGHNMKSIPNQHHPVREKDSQELSAREIEVLILITRGLINKEIADRLNISLTTVISHRKNITEKLGMKSVSALTVYAIMNGFIEADRI